MVGVFVGYDSPRELIMAGQQATGGQIPAPIFANFMKMALAGKKPIPFRQPPGIKRILVNAKTGLKAQPGESDTVLEVFKPSEEPDDGHSNIGFTGLGEQGSVSPVRSPRDEERSVYSGQGLR